MLGAVGGAAGAALGSETVSIVSFAGLAIGTLFGTYLGEGVPVPERLRGLIRRLSEDDLYRIKLEKLLLDIRESPLRTDVNLKTAFGRSIANLLEANIVGDRDPRIPSSPLLTFSENAWKGEPAIQDIKALQTLGRPIMVNCSCINVAASATLKAMADLFEINVIPYFGDPNGYSQVRTVADDDSVDFLVTANAPFFMAGISRLARRFRLLFPVHGEFQYVFKRSGTLWEEVKRVHILPQSSAEEQVLGGRHMPKTRSPSPVETLEIPASAIPNLLLDLDRPEAVVVWEPLASSLRRHPEVEREEESVFRFWISLFCQKRWRGPKMRRALTAFEEVFLAAWVRCKSNPNYAINLLRYDDQYQKDFALACAQAA